MQHPAPLLSIILTAGQLRKNDMQPLSIMCLLYKQFRRSQRALQQIQHRAYNWMVGNVFLQGRQNNADCDPRALMTQIRVVSNLTKFGNFFFVG